MEPHKQFSGIESYRPSLELGSSIYFEQAYKFVRTFYNNQLTQVSSVKFEEVLPGHFFDEYIWVVHATGFSAKAVGNFMPRLLDAYGIWDILGTEEFSVIFDRVKLVCNNPQKAKAIYSTAKILHNALWKNKQSWEEFKKENLSTPEKLTKLPYIGKITCYHLGRNIGLLNCVKPDLHLVRMASYWNYLDCLEMCKSIQSLHEQKTGEKLPLGIIDLILWYAASVFGTLSIKQEGQR